MVRADVAGCRLSACVRAATTTIESALQKTFIPAVREAAVVTCMNTSVNTLIDAFKSVSHTKGPHTHQERGR